MAATKAPVSSSAARSILSFDSKGGPLVAIVALCGGAGASTLCALLGTAAARASRAQVLACDSGGPTAGLSLYYGASSRWSLGEVAAAVDAGAPPAGGLVTRSVKGLRVLATAPRADAYCQDSTLSRVLRDARAAHGLTLVDCGVASRPGDRVALAAATHIAWVLPTSDSGVLRAAQALGAREPPGAAREVLVARASRGRRPPLKALRALAQTRRAPLVLMPEVGDLLPVRTQEALEAAGAALEALATVLRR